jgi:hypothetical protein
MGWGGWVGHKHAAGAEKRKMYSSPSGNQTPILWLSNPLPIHYTDWLSSSLISRHETSVLHRRLYKTDFSLRPCAKTNYEAQTLTLTSVMSPWHCA